jgi:hypothetical protein
MTNYAFLSHFPAGTTMRCALLWSTSAVLEMTGALVGTPGAGEGVDANRRKAALWRRSPDGSADKKRGDMQLHISPLSLWLHYSA